MASVLGTHSLFLILSWVTCPGRIKLPCYEAAPWRDPLGQGQILDNYYMLSGSGSSLKSSLQKKPQSQLTA